MLEAQSAQSGTAGTDRPRLIVMSGPDPQEPHVCACPAEVAEAQAIRAELASYLLALAAAQGALTEWRADLDALREDLQALADLSPTDLCPDDLDHG